MTHEIDCRGLACPAPVLQTKEWLEKNPSREVAVLVDGEASRENVSRFLRTQGFTVSTETEGRHIRVEGRKSGDAEAAPAPGELGREEVRKIMVMITHDKMGHGDDELGAKLMVSFLKTLKEMGRELWRLVFVNNGVKMTVRGSDVLPLLKEFEAAGIYILVCGTCLTHFDLLQEKEVGETTNMLDIVTAMQLADSVINI
ncbi:sulfurtransferase-like selenium metabolism protein YedF [Desulfatiglans anilini]|uniref:sulfurtransferase-like selenium metabolism protein YedF n=1 Tax=Desulfatiglans anilini TaxID=90728 RepID=UPI00041F5A38|nr:sulfurtransferase-like selenium metabolism protein YedF [Desulfatiglans anilini]